MSKLRQQQREIANLREQLEEMGKERDRCDDRQRQLKTQLIEAREDKKLQEQRVGALKRQLEHLSATEEKLADLQADNSRLLAESHRLESELDECRLQKSHLLAECEEATRRWNGSRQELEALADSVKTLRRNLADEVALHNATRERLAVEEGAHSRTRVEFQQQVELLEGELVAEKRAVAERLAAREQELESRRELVDHVQQGYVQRIAELETSLAQIQANVSGQGRGWSAPFL